MDTLRQGMLGVIFYRCYYFYKLEMKNLLQNASEVLSLRVYGKITISCRAQSLDILENFLTQELSMKFVNY